MRWTPGCGALFSRKLCSQPDQRYNSIHLRIVKENGAEVLDISSRTGSIADIIIAGHGAPANM
jgi:hypothetical protein